MAVLRIHEILEQIRIRGSITLTNGTGSCYFRQWPSRSQQKINFFPKLFCLLLLKVQLHHFSKIKSHKQSQNSRNQGFSYYFWLMIEGSGSESLTDRSGSGRPKNIWILRIRSTAEGDCKQACLRWKGRALGRVGCRPVGGTWSPPPRRRGRCAQLAVCWRPPQGTGWF